MPETKNGRPRKLAIRDDLLEQLKLFPRDMDRVFAVGLDYVVGAWSKACRMAGIEDLHIHDGRHEALSRLAESGKFTLPELQVFSGHRDLRMLMRYAHLCASRLARKLNECFKDDAKVRVHRGRKFLNKQAGLPIGSLTADTEEPMQGVPTSGQTVSPATSDCSPSSGVVRQAPSPENIEVCTSVHQEKTQTSGAAVFAFPASRMVGTFGREGAAGEQRREPVSQTPSAG